MKILIADDNRDAADSLGVLLSLGGHDVHTAYDGKEAVEAADLLRPDAIVLDIGMPKMNGYDAARHIRAQSWSSRAILIAITGWGTEEDKQNSKEAGFDYHLVKPVEPDEIEHLFGSHK